MRLIAVLAITAGLLAAGCGAPAGTKLDTTVAQLATTRIGVAPAAVRCEKKAPPPLMVGENPISTATHTCTLTLPDKSTQIWAVRVLDLVTTGTVQLQYRVDDDPNAGAPSIDVDATFGRQMAILTGGTVIGSRCRVPANPAKLGNPPPDHICTARIAGAKQRTFAVRIVGTGLQFLFEVR
jgi:hypothetical protein